jgi:thioredoxin-related protein
MKQIKKIGFPLFYLFIYFTLISYINNVHLTEVHSTLVPGYFIEFVIATYLFVHFFIHKYKYPVNYIWLLLLMPLYNLYLAFDSKIYAPYPIAFPILFTASICGILFWLIKNKIIRVVIVAAVLLIAVYAHKNIPDILYHAKSVNPFETVKKQLSNQLIVNAENKYLDFTKYKYTLMDFTRDGCVPCKLKTVALKKLKAALNNPQIAIVKVYVGDDYQNYLNYNKDTTIEIYNLSNRKMIDTLKIESVPTEIMVNNKGEIIYYESGYNNTLEAPYLKKHLQLLHK